MARLQLALNVADLDEAVAFYAKLFATEPAKLRPGYANFAIADPPLKLVLFEGESEDRVNHLGIEVMSPGEVEVAADRLQAAGEEIRAESGACCYAVQEKFWLSDPDGSPWEVYTVLEDVEQADACSCLPTSQVDGPVFATSGQDATSR